MRTVFVDASALVPIVVRNDQWRARWLQLWAALEREAEVELWTSNWTLYEALAIVQRRGKPWATDLFDYVIRRMQVHSVGEELEREALQRFLAWRDKTASVVDHANALAAVVEGCDSIMSFDSDFVPLALSAGLHLVH